MQDFTKLKVWARAHEFALAVDRASSEFPSDERFGLTSQLRRSASSVGSNIAEGAGRSSNIDFKRFLHIAAGSANEAKYQLLLAHDLGYLGEQEYQRLDALATETKRMLATLIARIRDPGVASGSAGSK